MSIPELTQQRLAQLCETRKIPRFSCEEMVELLEDGEEVAWILEQALPDGPSDVAGELGAILAEIAAQVAPPEKDDDGEQQKVGVAANLGEDLADSPPLLRGRAVCRFRRLFALGRGAAGGPAL